VKGCTIEDSAFVGMRATVQEGAVVKTGAFVSAGAVVSAGTTVPSGICFGSLSFGSFSSQSLR
jgi:carbonic anhydrase/acetyltransferase-like protein (isoleucine patch superfamily)